MFTRKVVLVALLAVVLLSVLMDASADGRNFKRKRRAATERPCATCLVQSLGSWMNTIAGVRPTIDPTRNTGTTRGAEPVDTGLNQIAGGARTPDPTGTSRTTYTPHS